MSRRRRPGTTRSVAALALLALVAACGQRGPLRLPEPDAPPGDETPDEADAADGDEGDGDEGDEAEGDNER